MFKVEIGVDVQALITRLFKTQPTLVECFIHYDGIANTPIAGMTISSSNEDDGYAVFTADEISSNDIRIPILYSYVDS